MQNEAERNSWELNNEVLGEQVIYPGHPLTVAYMIMHVYPDLDAAKVVSEFGWPVALSNGAISGAGGAVYNGLAILDYIREGLPVDEAIQRSAEAWKNLGYEDDREGRGQAQADRITDDFKAKAAEWITSPAPAPVA